MFPRRVQIIALFFCIAYCLVLGRLVYLQVIHGKKLKARGQRRIHRLEQIPPRRGSIIDRDGRIIAKDTPTCDLWFVPLVSSKKNDNSARNLGFGEINSARVASIIKAQGAKYNFEFKLALSYIMEQLPLCRYLSSVTGKSKKEIAKKILRAAATSVKNKISTNIYSPQLLLSDIGTKAYLRLLSDRSLRKKTSFLTVIEPRLGWKRIYNYGESCCHITGYVGHLSAREYKKLRGTWTASGKVSGAGEIPGFFVPTEIEKYLMRLYEFSRNGQIKRAVGHLANETVGRMGIEQEYNNILRGSHGLRHLRLSRPEVKGPRIMKVVGIEAPVMSGQDIKLTINAEVQRDIQQIISSELEMLRRARGHKFTAACVILDTRSGAIEALVSIPTFNPAEVSKRYREYISPQGNKPFLNRVIAENYPPGSTFKPFIAMCALKNKVITGESNYECKGFIRLGKHDFICMRRYQHGLLDVHNALRLSCNIFFYKTGQATGRRRIINFITDLGFGRKTGIDLPGEKPGQIPPSAFTGKGWSTGNTYHLAIGQGIAVTPIQLAVGVAAIANGGVIVKPHLVILRTKAEQDYQRPQRRLDLPQPALDLVRNAMWSVVNDKGTGVRAHLASLEISGKTGSADWKKGATTHALFIAYAPSKTPQIALVLIVPEGNFGGKTCGPIVKKILRRFFELPKEENAVG